MKGLPGKFGRPRATERISISVSITFIILVKGLVVATRENGCAAKRANHVRKIFGIVDLLPPCHCPIHCTWHSYKLQGSAKRLWSSWENAAASKFTKPVQSLLAEPCTSTTVYFWVITPLPRPPQFGRKIWMSPYPISFMNQDVLRHGRKRFTALRHVKFH